MLDSGMVNKIYKAKQYADEPQRIHFESLKVHFDGNNGSHEVLLTDGQWQCDCSYFASHRVCSHTMAMERVLGVMLPANA